MTEKARSPLGFSPDGVTARKFGSADFRALAGLLEDKNPGI